ncbi:MAG: hypothetical protein ACYDCF_09505, partial [Burkholderiales bacterium]
MTSINGQPMHEFEHAKVINLGKAGDSVYAGQAVSLLTQHGKERGIASVLGVALGCRVERVAGYDTDQLGTFTREIPRPGTQIEAARKKARL